MEKTRNGFYRPKDKAGYVEEMRAQVVKHASSSQLSYLSPSYFPVRPQSLPVVVLNAKIVWLA